MLIEAFSEAKDPSAPDTNEDRFVILPGRAFAVIDGVTDRLGTRYNGMLSGQYAAMIVKEALEHALTRPDRPTDTKLLIRRTISPARCAASSASPMPSLASCAASASWLSRWRRAALV